MHDKSIRVIFNSNITKSHANPFDIPNSTFLYSNTNNVFLETTDIRLI